MLKRSDLINIKNEFEYKIERDNLDINIIKDSLEKIISKLNYSDCKSDSRFVPYGRMLLLQEELDKNLNSNNFIDAYFNISDYLNESRISINGNPEIVDKNKKYFDEDIICNEEKEILIEMVNKYLLKLMEVQK